METKTRISEGGRIVLPSNFRKELNLNVGDEVILSLEGGEIHIMTLDAAIQQAQTLLKNYNSKNVSLVKSLKNMRNEDVKNEK